MSTTREGTAFLWRNALGMPFCSYKTTGEVSLAVVSRNARASSISLRMRMLRTVVPTIFLSHKKLNDDVQLSSTGSELKYSITISYQSHFLLLVLVALLQQPFPFVQQRDLSVLLGKSCCSSFNNSSDHSECIAPTLPCSYNSLGSPNYLCLSISP